MKFSYTKLDTYKQCPRKYKFYVDKAPQDPDKTLALRFGKTVHAALEHAFKDRYLPPSVAEVLSFYDKLWTPEGMPSEEVAQFEEGRNVLRGYLAQNPPQKTHAIAVEKKFSLSLDATHELIGVVDRIDQLPDGSFEIIDYKTSKQIPDAEKLNQNWQLAIYQYVEEKKLQSDRVRASLVFVMHGGHKLTYRFSNEELEKIRQEVLTEIRQIEEDTAFKTRTGWWCNTCQYQYCCPAWRHKYEITEDGLAPAKPNEEVVSIREKIDRLLRVVSSLRGLEEEEEQLKQLVREYAKSQDLTKLYSDLGTIAIRYGKKVSFDVPGVIEALDDATLRALVKTLDTKKLENLIESLPPDTKQKILALRRVEETVTVAARPKEGEDLAI